MERMTAPLLACPKFVHEDWNFTVVDLCPFPEFVETSDFSLKASQAFSHCPESPVADRFSHESNKPNQGETPSKALAGGPCLHGLKGSYNHRLLLDVIQLRDRWPGLI